MFSYIKAAPRTDRTFHFRAYKVNLSRQSTAGNQSCQKKSILAVRLVRGVMEGSARDDA